MSVISHIKEMISPEPGEKAEAWAAQWFAKPQHLVAGGVVHAVITITGGELDQLNDKTRLIEDLSLNELQRVQLLLAVERQFAVEISELDANGIQSLGQLVGCVHEKTLHSLSANGADDA